MIASGNNWMLQFLEWQSLYIPLSAQLHKQLKQLKLQALCRLRGRFLTNRQNFPLSLACILWRSNPFPCMPIPHHDVYDSRGVLHLRIWSEHSARQELQIKCQEQCFKEQCFKGWNFPGLKRSHSQSSGICVHSLCAQHELLRFLQIPPETPHSNISHRKPETNESMLCRYYTFPLLEKPVDTV